MKTTNINIIKEVFQRIADTVVPTMGAKGRMAIIEDEFSRPILTDDGVTVAKQAMNTTGFEKMVAISIIEAANNTEKTAFDGTTLTVLLTNELYKQGLRWVKAGMHPQNAADKLLELVAKAKEELKKYRIKLTQDQVSNLSTVVTKIPAIGALVAEAYRKSSGTMNVITEHERNKEESYVEFTSGMTIDSGYMSESLRSLCNDGDKTNFNEPYIAVLKEGIFTQLDTQKFFSSIPESEIKKPFVFVVSHKFNPESLKLLLDTLTENRFTFQIVFVNDIAQEELFLDIAAYTGGTAQDAINGTEFTFQSLGKAKGIIVEQLKTVLIADQPNGKALAQRIKAYRKEVDDKAYTTGMNRANVITRRLANLESGVTKIKIYSPTVTEYITIKLKLDDAIGAVKTATKKGIAIGGGKALWNVSFDVPELQTVLRKPMETIVQNAGLKITKGVINKDSMGINVVTKKEENLITSGIVDSYASIETSLTNASSIAANYLRAYILIRKD
jgi:chaperonin GroEL